MSVAITADRRTRNKHDDEQRPSSLENVATFQEQQLQQVIRLRDREELFAQQAAEVLGNNSIDSQVFYNESVGEVAGSLSSADTSPIMSVLRRDQSVEAPVITAPEELRQVSGGDKKGVAAPVPIRPTEDTVPVCVPWGNNSSNYSQPVVLKSLSKLQKDQPGSSSIESLDRMHTDIEECDAEDVFDLDL